MVPQSPRKSNNRSGRSCDVDGGVTGETHSAGGERECEEQNCESVGRVIKRAIQTRKWQTTGRRPHAARSGLQSGPVILMGQ